MSFIDYIESQEISKGDPGFAAIIMAACRKADSHNMIRIETMWPEIAQEMRLRYNAPGGLLEGEVDPRG